MNLKFRDFSVKTQLFQDGDSRVFESWGTEPVNREVLTTVVKSGLMVERQSLIRFMGMGSMAMVAVFILASNLEVEMGVN